MMKDVQTGDILSIRSGALWRRNCHRAPMPKLRDEFPDEMKMVSDNLLLNGNVELIKKNENSPSSLRTKGIHVPELKSRMEQPNTLNEGG